MVIISNLIVSNFDLVAIQGITDKSNQAAKKLDLTVKFAAYKKNLHAQLHNQANLCLLNFTSIASKRVVSKKHQEQYMFIFNQNRVKLKDYYQLNDMDRFHFDPLVGHFYRVDQLKNSAEIAEFTFLTFHAKFFEPRSQNLEINFLPDILQ